MKAAVDDYRKVRYEAAGDVVRVVPPLPGETVPESAWAGTRAARTTVGMSPFRTVRAPR